MKTTNLPSPESVDSIFEAYSSQIEESMVSNEAERLTHMSNTCKSNANTSAGSVQSAFDELMSMVGLDEVKGAVKRQVNYHKIMNIRKMAGCKTPQRLLHMLLTGNPGTGKTTVARLIGRIFKEEGILRSGHLIEANRASLVGQWIGETERKTSDMLKAASGGILFIDEIYSLVESGGQQQSSKDFGMKVIDTLMPCLSDANSDVMIIGAGYGLNVKSFLSANPGLASRFPLVLHFEDFSVDQLMCITENELNKYDFKLSPDARTQIQVLLTDASQVKNYGNARLVMTLVSNHLIPNMCNRLAQSENLNQIDIEKTGIILPVDLPSFSTLFPLVDNGRRSVGFTH